MAINSFEDYLVSKYKKYRRLSKRYPDNEKMRIAYYAIKEVVLNYNFFNNVNLWQKSKKK